MTPARLCADRRRRNQRQGRPGEALEAARARSAEGVTIQAIGVADAIRRFVAELGSDVAVRGLRDENEEPLFRRVLDDVYVCVTHLEGELIRALGVERMLQIVDRESFETMQRQPAQRDRPIELQLHRWLRSISARYHLYLPILVDALEPDRIPAPLAGVLGIGTQLQ